MITIFENGKYILDLPDWANNVYLKLEELPYKGGLCVLEISYRNKKAYCLYHPAIKRHTLWVDSVEELDKRYQGGEIDPLYGLTVYGTDMWGGEETLVVSKRGPYYIVSAEEREERFTQPEELGKYLTKQYGEWEEFEWINDNGAFIWCKPWLSKAVYLPVGNTIIRG